MNRRNEIEFSRPMAVEGLDEDGRVFRIEAEAEERTALARHLGLISVESLAVEGLLRADANRGLFWLEGRLTADVVQSCVVTLAPVASRIDVSFERLYGTGAEVENEWTGESQAGREIHLTVADELPPEPIFGGVIDVGAAAAEHLALELNPFPRAAGAVFEGIADTSADAPDAEEAKGPFAALAALRPKSGDRA